MPGKSDPFPRRTTPMSLRDHLSAARTDSVTAPPAVKRLGRYERELWFVAIAAMLVDVTLTVHGLQLGLRERNPVARAALDTAGAVGLYGLKTLAVVVSLCCRQLLPVQFRGIVPFVLAIPSLVAVGINATLISWVLV